MAKEYLETLLGTDKYARATQLMLKERVFNTFESLLHHGGRSGFQPEQKLLDLGSADGALVEVARKRGLNARGLDVTDRINFETDTFPFEDATYDVVTAVSVIEHLLSPDIFLREIMRVLKPGGAFIMVTPNWRYSANIFYDDPTHVHPYTPKSTGFLLRSVGFENITVVPWLVCKPSWMWQVPGAFLLARMLPFRGSVPSVVPGFLKGQSKSILALGVKPDARP
jgi:SAM-dependent methyltransferase